MNDKTKKLLTFGEKRSSEWPDYLGYFNFTETDIPDLIDIVSDESLHNAKTDGKEVWAPLHAWRALGQLKAAQAIQPLIDQFETLCDDDWALSEIQKVMGMIGKPAIKPLGHYFLSSTPSEYAKIMAMDGLAEIAKTHEKLKPQILDIFKTYMRNPDTAKIDLNGLLVSQLMDLHARELIDDIRPLYEQNLVDITISGDLEDVEISLGLREHRETPKPHYGMLMNPFNKMDEQKLNQPNLAELEAELLYTEIEIFLDKYGHDDSVLDISELDGFFASLACSPNTIMPSVWLAAIWGGEDKSPEWEDQNEFESFFNLIMQYYNQVITEFTDGIYEPLFLERLIENKKYTIVDEWCEGFTRALPLWPISQFQHDVALLNFLENISLFTTTDGLKALENLNDKEIEKHQNKIEPALHHLYHHYNKQRVSSIQSNTHTIIRNEPKTGRNDPCPCGSGKKFKKCCLH